MKRYAVTHETRYVYGLPVDIGLHIARLSPVDGARQKLIEHQIDVSPDPTWAVAFTDHFGNGMHHFSIETPHEELVVTQRTLVDIVAQPWADLPDGPAWETVRDGMCNDGFAAYPEPAEFIYASPLVPLDAAATAYAQEVFTPGKPLVAAVFELTKRIKAEFKYAPGTTTISTAVEEIMEKRRGVCQDFAHIMIAGLRGLGLSARYVSGYLKTYAAAKPEDEAPEDSNPAPAPEEDAATPLVGSDASHAWVSVWCGPEIGWLDFDPTNALAVADEHIAVAYGRDFSDVTPLRGIIMGGGSHALSVGVKVEHIDSPA